jgi:phosphatidylglycerol lysyltransferase
MFPTARRKPLPLLAAMGRNALALGFVAALTVSMVAALMAHPSRHIIVFAEIFNLDGLGWGRDGVIALGALLLLVARALTRGKRQAWWLSVGLLAFSLLSAERGHRATTLLILGLLVALLMLTPLFSTRSDARAVMRGYLALALGIACILSYGLVYHALRHGVALVATVSLWRILFILHVLAFLILSYGVVQVLRPVLAAGGLPQNERLRAREVVRRYGCLATAYFALGADKRYFWSETGQSLIAYRVVQGVALALGDPIGPEAEREPFLRAFLAFCRRQDWPVVFYQASPRMQALCQEQGLHVYKIGEEGMIDVTRFTLQESAMAPVRHSVARARRAGITVQCWQGEAIPEAVFAGMKRISMGWLDEQKIRGQMGFSMGRFPADWSPELLTVVALGPAGQVQAFLTWTPLYAGNGWALDNMRRVKETAPGVMELLLAESVEWAKAEGYAQMSLGLAPLAGLTDDPDGALNIAAWLRALSTAPLLECTAAFLHRRGVLLGNYRSLHHFKAKFQPDWEARYLIVSERAALPRMLAALARAHGNDWRHMLNRGVQNT